MSVHTYILYQPDDGRIVAVFSGLESDAIATASANGLPYLQADVSVNTSLKYVQQGQIVNRPANPSAINGTTLSNVPVPAVVWINSSFYPTNDSTVELEIANPGTYLVSVVVFPYVDASFEVTV